jgi:DNA repair exonuclease SbcCD ATPase subunit
MSLFAKIMVVLNFFLAVGFLAAAGTLLGASEDWKKRYEDVDKNSQATIEAQKQQIARGDQQLVVERQKLSDSEKGRASAETTQKMLQDSNASLEQANSDMRSSLNKAMENAKDLVAKNSEQNATIDKLRNDLSTEASGRRDVEGKYKAAQDEIARLAQDKDTAEKGLASQQAENTGLTSRVDELSTLLARYKQEKGALTGAVVMKAVKGVVQAVSNKEDIFVLSVGKKDGVEAGYEFTIYRDSEYVSTVVIDKVFDQYSSGRTKPGTKRKDVMAGDEASTQL